MESRSRLMMIIREPLIHFFIFFILFYYIFFCKKKKEDCCVARHECVYTQLWVSTADILNPIFFSFFFFVFNRRHQNICFVLSLHSLQSYSTQVERIRQQKKKKENMTFECFVDMFIQCAINVVCLLSDISSISYFFLVQIIKPTKKLH